MIKDSILNLKDYRIIKVMLEGKNPNEYSEQIKLSKAEINARLEKIKIQLPRLFKLKISEN